MVTISQVVKKIIDSRPTLQETLIEDIVNYSSLAERLRPRVEAELGEEVKRSAVVMAIRRYAETLQKKSTVKASLDVSPEIIMKTNLCDLCLVKTPSALKKIEDLYKMVDYEKGDTFNVIQGNYEITIVISQKHLAAVQENLKSEKILNVEKELVSLTLGLPKEFLYTPGVLSFATRKLSWENINIVENISTMTELIFVISQKDAVRAYNAFSEMNKELAKGEEA